LPSSNAKGNLTRTSCSLGAELPPVSNFYLVSCLLALAALVAVLALGLLSALLSGLLVYNLVQFAAPAISRLGVSTRLTKTIALALLAGVFTLLVAAAIFGGASQLTGGSESVVTLLKKMAEIIDTARVHLPAWALDYFPSDLQELEALAARLLREHAGQLQLVGRDVGVLAVHIIVGMVIGGLIALSSAAPSREPGPLASALADRVVILSKAFRNIVFSQIRISALNTFLTAIYLVAVLPSFGIHLPFVRTMIAVTFVAGLLPVIGNLISNTVIVVVSLSISFIAAIGSLAFLIVIHKLEYFVNARIIGSRIKARAWELLLAMVVMEAWFGVPGLIAAPIYYAYVKDELAMRELI
jgi:predicted PurR-regulated permease PerM